jgi:uncharacterized coiled-coil protein SlyX
MEDPFGLAERIKASSETLDARRAEIEKRNADNDRRIVALNQELASQGASVDPNSITRALLSSLAEHLFGDMNYMARLDFEDRYTRNIETMLRNMEGEVRRAKLTAGIHLNGGRPR